MRLMNLPEAYNGKIPIFNCFAAWTVKVVNKDWCFLKHC